MPYTKVNKPTDTSYTKVRNGYPLFDDSTVLYDDPTLFFDGNSSSGYVNISKPTSSVYTKILKPT